MSEAINKYKFPVHYDEDYETIEDSVGLTVFDLDRSFYPEWSDEIAPYIVAAINEKHERESVEVPENCVELAKGSYLDKNGIRQEALITTSGKYYTHKNNL